MQKMIKNTRVNNDKHAMLWQIGQPDAPHIGYKRPISVCHNFPNAFGEQTSLILYKICHFPFSGIKDEGRTWQDI